MLCGLDQLSGGNLAHTRRRLRGSRIALLSHAAALDRKGRTTLEVLEELGAFPVRVFTPEHGFYGVEQAEEPVAHTQTEGDRPAFTSLYGTSLDSLSPSAEHFEDIDIVVIDLVDVGSRYYTYTWTALLTARAAAKANVHTLILDRPNPIGGDPSTLEGTVQDEAYLSFVGLEPMPVRHAMTLGEIVALFMERDGHALGEDGALTIARCVGWERHRTARAWGRPFIMPSPNMPSLQTALCYPGGCLLEGTNLSEGRGTTAPFQQVGAPFLDGAELARQLRQLGTPGALIREIAFKPSFDKHAGEVCSGIMVHVGDPGLFRPVATYATIITLARQQASDRFEFLTRTYEMESERRAFDLLAGSDAPRQAIENGASADEVIQLMSPVAAEWRDKVLAGEARLELARAN